MKNLRELVEQIEEVEGVKLSVLPHNFTNIDNTIYYDYPYTNPMNGNKTVDDLLYERVYPALNNILFHG